MPRGVTLSQLRDRDGLRKHFDGLRRELDATDAMTRTDGHARRALVRPGQIVRAGQPVSIAGGVGAPHDPGHMEVGFALTQDGVIPQSLSCDHYTRSGGQMHALMHQLNPYLVGAAPIHDPPRCPPKRRR